MRSESVGSVGVRRGVAALVTDGAVRDAAGILGTALPVWCAGVAAPPSVAGLTFVGWQEPVACGGGAVLIPAALLASVLAGAPEQERLERWIMAEIKAGAALPGLYPIGAEATLRYEAAKRSGTA